MSKIYSNIVPESKVREKQSETLEIIANSLVNSFGPMGSHTAIIKNMDKNGVNINVEYSKDGYTIIKNILFNDTIERSVQDLLTSLTRYIVKEVGDGTTSAIILCNTIFKYMSENELLSSSSPYDSIKRFNEIISEVTKRIYAKARECTLDDIYKIALISTNNNEEISQTLLNIYKQYGLDVFIDVGTANGLDNIVKEYDGMTLETGITDSCFINDHTSNSAKIRNPKIYAFNDPIDTPEMLALLDKILYNNILRCYAGNSVYEPIPTVIFCKHISQDTSSYFETIVKLMNSPQFKGSIPLLIVSDIHQYDIFEDITKMCGAPMIKKYLNPDLQQADIEKGLAPTEDTILDFCGSAEMVESDQMKTKVIRPAKMFDENGEYSDEYKMYLNFLESQVEKAIADNANIDVVGKAKRRLNSFKGNMVDFLIGGISMSDRDNLKASVEDAVLNCRSAAKYGVGYGANFMALSTLHEMLNEDTYSIDPYVQLLHKAYFKLSKILYESRNYYKEKDYGKNIVHGSIENGCPLNIRTNLYDNSVLSSIRSDIVILETVGRIISLMYTCNQYLVQTPVHNIYIGDE